MTLIFKRVMENTSYSGLLGSTGCRSWPSLLQPRKSCLLNKNTSNSPNVVGRGTSRRSPGRTKPRSLRPGPSLAVRMCGPLGRRLRSLQVQLPFAFAPPGKNEDLFPVVKSIAFKTKQENKTNITFIKCFGPFLALRSRSISHQMEGNMETSV